MNRIPSLDGWRGIAILLVLFEHMQISTIGSLLRPWTQTGQHGVNIFFVLSGYLITAKLLERPIDLKHFYLRRFFRLMPVAWAYLLVIWLLLVRRAVPIVSVREVVSCLFFFRNFLGSGTAEHPTSLYTFHFWSLSLEEQFYLVWPCLLFLAGRRNALWIAIGGALTCASYRFLHWSAYDQFPAFFLSQVRADALLVGCILALLLAKQRFLSIATRWSLYLAWPSFAVLLICMAYFQRLIPLFENLAIAGLIAFTTLHPKAIASRFFSFAPLAWLGVISYSVYVWQQIFTYAKLRPSDGSSYYILMCLMPLCAIVSYYYVERPFIRLGYWLTREIAPTTPGTVEPAEVAY